ncbi:MAG: OmpA family protein [Desulfobacterales bacterium]|nr:MAG: OmpA family protein [Desulfobacterales bacterium]
MMINKVSAAALLFSFLLVLSCVSKSKYVELETELNSTGAELAENQKNLETLQNRNRILLDENGRLIEAIEALRLELQQEKLTVLQKEEKISDLDKTRREIETNLKEQIAQKDIKIEEIEGRLKVTFVDKILFDSGSVTIKDQGKQVLLRLAESFKDNQNQNIIVEGHTDDMKIGPALQQKFPTNWELSTARATAVVRFLQEQGNIAPEQLTASGFSFYRPVASNDSEEGRRQNRRIEIIMVPE